MSFTESNTVEQVILDATTSLVSVAGRFFRPRMTRMFTDGIQSMSFLSVPIREIRGSNFLP